MKVKNVDAKRLILRWGLVRMLINLVFFFYNPLLSLILVINDSE